MSNMELCNGPFLWNFYGLNTTKVNSDMQDVSRLRHSPPIALTKEDPTGGELPIGEFLLQNRSVP